jgi:hypothetical protein
MACFGANASGKTNILKAVAFVKWLFCDSWDLAHNAAIPILPFQFSDEQKQTVLKVIFGLKGKKYTYEISLDQERIFFEKLSMAGVTKPYIILERVFDENNKAYSINFHKDWFSSEMQKMLESTARQNSPIIASASRSNHELSVEIVNYFSRYQFNVTIMGHVPAENQEGNALQHFSQDPALKEIAVEYLKKFDTGLTGLTIEPAVKTDETGISMAVFGIHGDKKLPYFFESSGTRNLAVNLHLLLPVLKNGGVAIIDELDANLHPLILSEIVATFISPSLNPLNAQLFFSSHTPSILNELDKQQILLTEKNEDGASVVWLLSDMKSQDSRSGSNYYAKYMAGSYGGIPKL